MHTKKVDDCRRHRRIVTNDTNLHVDTFQFFFSLKKLTLISDNICSSEFTAIIAKLFQKDFNMCIYAENTPSIEFPTFNGIVYWKVNFDSKLIIR